MGLVELQGFTGKGGGGLRSLRTGQPPPSDPPPTTGYRVMPGVVYTQADIHGWSTGIQYDRLAASPGGNLGRSITTPGATILVSQLAALRDDSVWAKCQAVLWAVDGNPARLAAVRAYLDRYRTVTHWQRADNIEVPGNNTQTQRLNAAWILDNMTQAASIIGYSDSAWLNTFLIGACLKPGAPLATALLDWTGNGNWLTTMAAARLGIAVHADDKALWDQQRAYFAKRLRNCVYHSTYDGNFIVPLLNPDTNTLMTGTTLSHWNTGATQVVANGDGTFSPSVTMPDGTNCERRRDHGHVCLGLGGIVHAAFTIRAQGEALTLEEYDRIKAALNYHAARMLPYFQSGAQTGDPRYPGDPWPASGLGGPEYQQSYFPSKRLLGVDASLALQSLVVQGPVFNYSASGANHLVAEMLAQ